MNKAVKPTLLALTALILMTDTACSVRARQTDNDEKLAKNETSGKSKLGRHSEGVKLDRETQERIGIELEVLKPATGHPEVTIYGTLEQDPSEEFVLRSPLAGVVVSDRSWPVLGATVAAGAKVGVVRPRLTAIDQLTLNERLAASRSEVEAAHSSVAAAREEANRLRQLNADNKNASDKALQEAQAHLATEKARLKAAQSSERLIGIALQPDSNAGSAVLEMRKGGQVLEVSAQPGESVESGQVLIRVANFNRLLARVYVPPGQAFDTSVTRAMIASGGHEENSVPAQRVALAGSIDPKYQGETLLFRLAPTKVALRPGQAITATVAVPGPDQQGVLIPSRAILRFQGQTWVYVRAEAGEFVRRVVALDRPARDGWIAISGFQPGQQVVVSGAQLLLSEEMKSQLESGAE